MSDQFANFLEKASEEVSKWPDWKQSLLGVPNIKIGLFDMDDTLFDYTGTLRRDMASLMSPEEEPIENLFDDSKPYLKARMDLIKSKSGWWRNLPPLKLGMDLFDLACKMGFKNFILTKGPESKRHAWTEKAECVDHHLGKRAKIDIVGEDKSGRYGSFLVDDYSDYVLGWLEYRPRGLAILPKHEHNKDFKHPNAVHYDGTNLAEIEKLLTAVKIREPGTHWKEYLRGNQDD